MGIDFQSSLVRWWMYAELRYLLANLESLDIRQKLRLITATSHFHHNILEYTGIWDTTVWGLPASSLVVSSSAGYCVAVKSSLLFCRSTWQPLGSGCTAWDSTSVNVGFFLQQSIAMWPASWQHWWCRQRREKYCTWSQFCLGGRASKQQSPPHHLTTRQIHWRTCPCWVVIVSVLTGIPEENLYGLYWDPRRRFK